MKRISHLKKIEGDKEVKKRYRMYKAKKKWIYAPILFVGLLGGSIAGANEVSASELDDSNFIPQITVVDEKESELIFLDSNSPVQNREKKIENESQGVEHAVNKASTNELDTNDTVAHQTTVVETVQSESVPSESDSFIREREGKSGNVNKVAGYSSNDDLPEESDDEAIIKEKIEIKAENSKVANDSKNIIQNEESFKEEQKSKVLNENKEINQEKNSNEIVDSVNLKEEFLTNVEHDKSDKESINSSLDNNVGEIKHRVKREEKQTNLISGDLKVDGKNYTISKDGKNVDLVITLEKIPSLISGTIINNGQSFTVKLPSILSEALKNQDNKDKSVNIKVLTSGGTILFDSESSNKDYGNWLKSKYAAEVEHNQERENSSIFSNLDIFNIGKKPYSTKTTIYINNVYDKEAKMQREANNSLYGDRYKIKIKYTFDRKKFKKFLII